MDPKEKSNREGHGGGGSPDDVGRGALAHRVTPVTPEEKADDGSDLGFGAPDPRARGEREKEEKS